ncbi:hypothetical protein EXS74_01900 [Candidatus Woesearchaeota archaeon]|nr:hypothetical protein [Candidatus Woesearchaeota archaeon]
MEFIEKVSLGIILLIIVSFVSASTQMPWLYDANALYSESASSGVGYGAPAVEHTASKDDKNSKSEQAHTAAKQGYGGQTNRDKQGSSSSSSTSSSSSVMGDTCPEGSVC